MKKISSKTKKISVIPRAQKGEGLMEVFSIPNKERKGSKEIPKDNGIKSFL